jgi:hypothetical protein
MPNETNNVDIESGTVNVAVFSQTDAALAGLREKYSEVPDAETKDGYALVKAGCKELTTLRTSIDKARKEIKQPYLEAGRIIDAEAKRITEALVELETPMKAAKKLVDDREKREKEERLARLREKIAGIREFIGKARGQESVEVAVLIGEVDAIDCSKDFYDLSVEAAEARTDTLQQLNEIYTERLQFEISEKERKELEERQREGERKRQIENKLNDLKAIPLDFVGRSSKEIEEKQEALRNWYPQPEVFCELHAEAVEALNSVIGKLNQLKESAEYGERAREDEKEQLSQQERFNQQVAEGQHKAAGQVGFGIDMAESGGDKTAEEIVEAGEATEDREVTEAEIITRFFAGFAEFNPQQAEAITEVIMSDGVPGVTITVTKEKL